MRRFPAGSIVGEHRIRAKEKCAEHRMDAHLLPPNGKASLPTGNIVPVPVSKRNAILHQGIQYPFLPAREYPFPQMTPHAPSSAGRILVPVSEQNALFISEQNSPPRQRTTEKTLCKGVSPLHRVFLFPVSVLRFVQEAPPASPWPWYHLLSKTRLSVFCLVFSWHDLAFCSPDLSFSCAERFRIVYPGTAANQGTCTAAVSGR